MDRSFLFLALAASAWAQQAPQPAQPGPEGLRDRVQQYYQLIADKKYRQAEAFVAEESKDDYYNGSKPDLKGFEVASIDLQSPTTAKVTVRGKVMAFMPLAGAHEFNIPFPSYWKVENNLWCWYIPEETKGLTPFGKIKVGPRPAAEMDRKGAVPGTLDKPDVSAILSKISLDRTAVVLSSSQPEQTVTITNGLPGPLDLVLNPHVSQIKGIVVEVDTLQLPAGAKTTVHIRRRGQEKVSDTISITAEPLGQVLTIAVSTE